MLRTSLAVFVAKMNIESSLPENDQFGAILLRLNIPSSLFLSKIITLLNFIIERYRVP